MRAVSRRSSVLVPALGVLVAVASGCTTFSDNDAVARVGDVELNEDDLADQAVELGIALPDQPLTADQARNTLNEWIRLEVLGGDDFTAESFEAIDDAAIVGSYLTGFDASGVTCVSVLGTDTVADAEAAADRLRAGEAFTDVFADANTNPGLDTTQGVIGCIRLADIDPSQLDLPDFAAVRSLDADTDVAVAELTDLDGDPVGALTFRRRAFDELTDADAEIVRSVIAPRLVIADLDVHVDPRYGTFDRESAIVVPLG